MNKIWQNTFLIYSKTDEFKNRIIEANKIIENALFKEDKIYLAFSGGKDSTVMLDLVLEHDSEIMILFRNFNFGTRQGFPDKIRLEIIENAQKIGAKYIRQEPVYIKDFFSILEPKLIKEGYTGVFVGIRKQESYSRKLRIKNNRSLSQINEYWPVQNFTWMDIWAYIISNKLPYHSQYDLRGDIIGWDKVRFTSLFNSELNKFGNQNVDGILNWKYRNL